MSLFRRQLPVLFYSRTKLICGLVTVQKPRTVKVIWEKTLDLTNLDQVLNQLTSKLGHKNWHVLIADELCYYFELSFSPFVTVSREEIAEQILTDIPEELSDEDWDYKLERSEAGNLVAKVFSPVQEYWQVFKKALKQAEMEVVAVEPETLAKTRNPHPMIGVALKSDLVGVDANVLNIQIPAKPLVTKVYQGWSRHKYKWPILTLSVAMMVFLFSSLIISFQTSQPVFVSRTTALINTSILTLLRLL
jgi:hypothetical protein